MNENALTILKFGLIAVLYLFLARVVWVVASELRVLRAPRTPVAPDPPPGAATPNAAPAASKGRDAGGKRTSWRLLTVAPKNAKGRSFTVDHEITIGRAPGCAIHIPDDTFVSSLHARVFLRDDLLHVEDLGSTNGTTVNGGRVSTPTRLRKGDRIQVGGTVLEARR